MSAATHVDIHLTNETEGYSFNRFVEELEDEYTLGDLYRMAQREYGRCQSRVYVGDGKPAGWFFVSRQRYEDTGEPYLRGAWVTPLVKVEDAQPAQYEVAT